MLCQQYPKSSVYIRRSNICYGDEGVRFAIPSFSPTTAASRQAREYIPLSSWILIQLTLVYVWKHIWTRREKLDAQLEQNKKFSTRFVLNALPGQKMKRYKERVWGDDQRPSGRYCVCSAFLFSFRIKTDRSQTHGRQRAIVARWVSL